MWPISKDGLLDKLIVFVDLDGDAVPVGQLLFEGRRPRYSYFTYARSWLERADRFAIAPAGLATGRKAIPSTPYEVPLAFYDAAPDGWGKAVLQRSFPTQVFGMGEFLAAAGENRTGYLRFGPSPDRPPSQWVPGETELIQVHGTEDLEALLAAANAIEVGEPTRSQMHLLFRTSADQGGARPKTGITKNGIQYLAKFPALDDRFDDPRIEGVCLSLAVAAGIDVPDHEVIRIARRSVLLVRRFDRSEGAERLGFISAATLLKHSPVEYHTNASYSDIASVARAEGIEPCEHELFRRMLFNAFIHNTDDHLRNHGFVRIAGKWRLSPVFDLVPCVQANMVLRPVPQGDPAPEPAILFGAHPKFRLKRNEANDIYEQVAAAMDQLPELLDRFEVTQPDRETIRQLMPYAYHVPALGAGPIVGQAHH